MSAYDIELVNPLLSGIITKLESLAKEAGSLPKIDKSCPVGSLRPCVNDIHIKLISLKADLNEFFTRTRKLDADIADMAKKEYDQLLQLTKKPSDDDLRGNYKSVLEAHLLGCVEEACRVRSDLIRHKIKVITDCVNQVKQESKQPEGVWSKPMSKVDIMKKLGFGLRGYRKLNTFTKDHPIIPSGDSGQLWMIRIDRMPLNLQAKFK